MMTIIFRTITIYVLLTIALRLMGKRQIGELEISELITTLLISEIASSPIGDENVPLLSAVIPITTLVLIEVCSSYLLITFPRLKSLFSSRPTVLVRNGKPLRKELKRARITMEELISALRQKDVSDISEVAYTILEPNGQISVTKKKRYLPPDATEFHIYPKENGITHILVADGKADRHNLKKLPHGRNILLHTLEKENCTVKDILLLLVDDGGKVYVVRKDDKSHRRR